MTLLDNFNAFWVNFDWERSVLGRKEGGHLLKFSIKVIFSHEVFIINRQNLPKFQ